MLELLLARVLDPAFPPGLFLRPRTAVPSLLASNRCLGNRLFSSNFRAERKVVLSVHIYYTMSCWSTFFLIRCFKYFMMKTVNNLNRSFSRNETNIEVNLNHTKVRC